MLVPTPPFHGFTQVHGHHGLVNSYWAKLQGLHALLLAESNIFAPHTICNLVLSLLDVTIKAYSTKSSNLTLTCPASLNMLTSSVLSSRVHYLCSIQFTFCYVVGHQDNLMFEDLPLIIHLNVQADTMAKQAIHILVGNDTVPILLPLPGKQWAFLANSIPVLQLLLDYLRQLKPLNCHPVLDPERPTLITCSVSHQLGASRSSHNLQLPNLLSVDF